jgi:septal ring factor EnvC (AmiA/AmiB activator)
MSRFPFIAGLTIIAVGVVVLVAVVQDQRHLRSVQRELDQAKEQVIRSKATADDLEKSAAKLKRELDETNKARTQLQGNLDEARLRKEQLKENQTHAQELMTELHKLALNGP